MKQGFSFPSFNVIPNQLKLIIGARGRNSVMYLLHRSSCIVICKQRTSATWGYTVGVGTCYDGNSIITKRYTTIPYNGEKCRRC